MRQDILVDTDGNPLFQGGDFLVGPSDAQHIEHIAIAHPGHYINAPLLGAGWLTYLKGPNTPANRQALARDLKLHCLQDGYKESDIRIEVPDLSQLDVYLPDTTATITNT